MSVKNRATENDQNVQSLPEFLSPKEIAQAAHVSESSVKRWCDRGLVVAERTAGGHRRVRTADAVAFFRQAGRTLDLDALGVGRRKVEAESAAATVEALTQALTDGDAAETQRRLTGLYLSGWSFARVCDEGLAEAFRRIGDRWACRTVEVYQERRACGVALWALDALKAIAPEIASDAPLAIGAAPGGDPYGLPTEMCELVLHEAGWRAHSLGNDLPFDTLLAAVRRLRPNLFWLSVSVVADEAAFLADWRSFVERIGPHVVTVVGGSALHVDLRRKMPFTAHADDMQRLQEFAKLCRLAADAPTSERKRT